MDNDIVQEDGDDIVQEADLPAARAPRVSRRTLRWMVLLSRQGQAHDQSAVALLRVSSRVAITVDEVTDERQSLRQDDLDFDPAFFAEYVVEQVMPLDEPEPMRWPCTFSDLTSAMRRRQNSVDIIQSLRFGDTVSFISVPVALVDRVMDGSWHLLASVPGRSMMHCHEQLHQMDLPPPPRSQFRAASRRRALTGIAFRARKKRKSDLTAADVQKRILWTRASHFFKNCDKVEAGASAVIDAIMNNFGDGEATMATEKVPARRQLLANRIRIDAVSCLLQRRENHDFSLPVVRGMRCDASPKLNAEIMATEVETVVMGEGGVDIQTEFFPGATLVHGCSRLAQKVYIFLWGLFLTCGPTLQQLRKVLRSIRWVVSDFGVEAGMVNAIDCLEAWAHWAHGLSSQTSPSPDQSSFLLPFAVHIPGWCHAWSNIIKDACQLTSRWASRLTKLRVLVRFLKVTDYRFVWGQALRIIGCDQEATELEKNFKASFANWRWETIAQAFMEIRRVGRLGLQYFDSDIFGKVQDTELLRSVDAVFSDHEFIHWVSVLAFPLQLAECARLWGTWCSCHDFQDLDDRKAACPLRGRRLHEAAAYLDSVCEQLLDWRQQLSLEKCFGYQVIFEEQFNNKPLQRTLWYLVSLVPAYNL
jgi:hypothetical protein